MRLLAWSIVLACLSIAITCTNAQGEGSSSYSLGTYVDDEYRSYGNSSVETHARFGKGIKDRLNPYIDDLKKRFSSAGIVKYINSKAKSFKAKVYKQFEGKTIGQLRSYLGSVVTPEADSLIARLKKKTRTYLSSVKKHHRRSKRGADPNCLPKQFDTRKKWPNCAGLVDDIQEQADCGACWAVSTGSAITIRRCIASKGKNKERLSAWDMVECCVKCRPPGSLTGCKGGIIQYAAEFFIQDGVCTGDRYQGGGCKPYLVPPNNKGGSEFGDSNGAKPTPCEQSCQSSYKTKPYSNDKHFGDGSIRVFDEGDEEAIMREIKEQGPVVAGFDVYEDFFAYKSGVYRYSTGGKAGGHAVIIIGWGEENGQKYWLCVNSWGANWGEKGMFKIVRGENHVGFERFVTAVTAKPE